MEEYKPQGQGPIAVKLTVEKFDILGAVNTDEKMVWVEDGGLEDGGYHTMEKFDLDKPEVIYDFQAKSDVALRPRAVYVCKSGNTFMAITETIIVNFKKRARHFSIPTELILVAHAFSK